MREIDFPDWEIALHQASLPERLKRTFSITIRWYLSFCRRSRGGVNHESARAFVEWAQKEKQPQAWQVEGWKEALRWFFRHARDDSKMVGQPATGDIVIAAEGPLPEWKKAFLTEVRKRHYSYRTEQSYLVWIERFVRHLGSEDLQSRGDEEIAGGAALEGFLQLLRVVGGVELFEGRLPTRRRRRQSSPRSGGPGCFQGGGPTPE